MEMRQTGQIPANDWELAHLSVEEMGVYTIDGEVTLNP